MKTIPLRKSPLLVFVDDEDYEMLSEYNWYLKFDGYAVARSPMLYALYAPCDYEHASKPRS
jgi:hypothetical protein